MDIDICTDTDLDVRYRYRYGHKYMGIDIYGLYKIGAKHLTSWRGPEDSQEMVNCDPERPVPGLCML